MTLALILVLLLPTLVMAGSLANGADNLIDFLKPYIEKGLPNDPPGWLVGLGIAAIVIGVVLLGTLLFMMLRR